MKKGVGSISQRYRSGDPDTDPHQNAQNIVPDPYVFFLLDPDPYTSINRQTK
jgi:hypothetical protein